MPDSGYGQREQMEHPSMVGTLHAQAELIWPLEHPVLERRGLGRSERLADLGSGTGQFAGRLAAAYPDMQIRGLEIYEGHLAEAQRQFPSERFPNLQFHLGDARRSGWEAGTFDAVTVRHFLHALPEPNEVLREARRLLKPHGLLYVLAEDYGGLLFDSPMPEAAQLFTSAAPGVLGKGTDLLHGRKAYRALRAAGFDDVRVEPIVVDTHNSPREMFASMLRYWRDGYASFLAEALGCQTIEVVKSFDALMLTVLDTDRYACWMLFAVTGRRPDYESR